MTFFKQSLNLTKTTIALSLGLATATLTLSPTTVFANTVKTQSTLSVETIKQEKNPNQFLQNVGESLFAELKAKETDIKKNPNVLKTVVKEKLMPHVHVKYAGSLILGSNYPRFTAEERDRYFAVLEDYLVQQYAQIFTLYKGQQVKYIATPVDNTESKTAAIHKGLVQVLQKNANPISINFSLRKNTKTGEWQVYDVVSEGLSLIQTKKQEWAGLFRQKQMDKLIQDLKETSQKDIVAAN